MSQYPEASPAEKQAEQDNKQPMFDVIDKRILVAADVAEQTMRNNPNIIAFKGWEDNIPERRLDAMTNEARSVALDLLEGVQGVDIQMLAGQIAELQVNRTINNLSKSIDSPKSSNELAFE